MSCLSWNCQGLGHPRAVRLLGDLLRDLSPSIVFLMETKLDDHGFDNLRGRLNMFGIGVAAEGRSGGLALLWDKQISVTILNYSKNHIDANIQLSDSSKIWRFTGFYGEAEHSKRKRTWNLLKDLGTRSHREWLVLGDFNEILVHEEKLGGPLTPEWRLRDFREALVHNDLVDLGYSGYQFTWSNKREIPNNMKLRLDRGVANTMWCDAFPDCQIRHLTIRKSDHLALFANISPNPQSGPTHHNSFPQYPTTHRPHQNQQPNSQPNPQPNPQRTPHSKPQYNPYNNYTHHRPKPKPFRFEQIWLRSDECQKVIAESWTKGDDFIPNLERCTVGLLNWSRAKYPNVRKEIRRLNVELEKLNHLPYSADVKLKEKELKSDLEDMLDREEVLWKQRAKTQWMVEGDRNTKFFHSQASKRAKWNLISGLKDSVGVLQTDPSEMGKIAVNYFGEIFSSIQPTEQDIDRVVKTMRSRVDGFINRDLSRLFSTKEVRTALFDMYPTKSPGPDVSFLLCESEWDPLSPERGLRQGDPLSPYLFLFCTEAFSSLLVDAEARNTIRGITINSAAPSVSHLLFADDTLIFCVASMESAVEINEILRLYSLASSQLINLEKSTVVFSRNASPDTIVAIRGILPVEVVEKHEKYLGLPTEMGKSKRQVFSWIRERLWERTLGFGEKNLSMAGKEVMIKSVLQSIPTYVMGCFKLPDYLIREMESIIARFWWGDGQKNKIHWVKWDTLCESKRDGGMGFRDLGSFNLALLGKQVWRIIQQPNSLLSRILKAKYFPTCDVLDVTPNPTASFSWKSIYSAIELVKTGVIWRVGNGESVSVWGDPWIPGTFNRKPLTPDLYDIGDTAVSNFLKPNGLGWDRELLNCVFWECDIEAILQIPISRGLPTDIRRWALSRNGHYNVKTAYYSARDLKQRKAARAASCSNYVGRNWAFVLRIEQFNLFICICWRLWYTRNTLVHERKAPDPPSVVQFAAEFLARYREAKIQFAAPRPSESQQAWKPPTGATIKVNVDAAIFKNSSTAGLGLVARDSSGKVVTWRQRRVHSVICPELAETLAILEGLRLAKEFGRQQVTIESDCLSIINSINSSEVCLAASGHLVDEIKAGSSSFSVISFQHSFRSANSLAHDLASIVVADSDGTQLPFDFA